MGEFTDKAKGKIKQAVGEVTGNDKLKREGQLDEAKGNIKGAVNDVKEVAKDAKRKIEDALD